MPTLTYRARDRKTKQTIDTYAGVLAPVVAGTAGVLGTTGVLSGIDTTSLFPGMAVFVSGAPVGAYIHSITNATTVELFAPLFTPATSSTPGTWGRAAAVCTAGTDLKVIAQGFNPEPIPKLLAEGTWRNLWTVGSVANAAGTQVTIPNSNYNMVPITSGSTLTGHTLFYSDTLNAAPQLRDKRAAYSVYEFVCSGGARCHCTAKDTEIVYVSTQS